MILFKMGKHTWFHLSFLSVFGTTVRSRYPPTIWKKQRKPKKLKSFGSRTWRQNCLWHQTTLISPRQSCHCIPHGLSRIYFSLFYAKWIAVHFTMQGRSQKKLMTEAMSMEDLWPRQSVHGWVLFLGIKSVYNDYKQQKWKKLPRQVPRLACY